MLLELPNEIINTITNYLWGTPQVFKKQLNIIEGIKHFTQFNLKPISIQKYKGVIREEVDLDVYCFKCGEKTVFPFTLQYCDSCASIHERLPRQGLVDSY